MYLLGMDLGGTNLKTTLFRQDFSPVGESRVPTGAEQGPGHVLERMREAVENLLEEQKVSQKEVACLGVGIPGLLDMERGISLFSPNMPGWDRVPVGEYLRDSLGLPVAVDNDVRVNMYGEWKFGAGRGEDHVVLLTIGTGLGAAAVVDGRVLYGATASAAEAGHMNVVPAGGRPCRCGGSGCLGRYVSALGMLRTAKEKLESGGESVLEEWCRGDREAITAHMLSHAYDQGDPCAVETLRETGEWLGLGLVNLINLYNPRVVIIGGGVSAAGERLLAPARRVVEHRALAVSRKDCSIVTAQLGDAAGMAGAAWFAGKTLGALPPSPHKGKEPSVPLEPLDPTAIEF